MASPSVRRRVPHPPESDTPQGSPAPSERLLERVRATGAKLPEAYRVAYYELVEYPAHGAHLMNLKYYWADRNALAVRAATRCSTPIRTARRAGSPPTRWSSRHSRRCPPRPRPRRAPQPGRGRPPRRGCGAGAETVAARPSARMPFVRFMRVPVMSWFRSELPPSVKAGGAPTGTSHIRG
ncbi:hypothetical protein EJ357_04190 [Streptomyces cyaneochromogenes]|uniref:Uncharacterized protein n=1 Tax=Streptomyces cyaneochromogenes TaxID=2496836 RepID=A0A3S9M114_9ACTN|nr:hypothetical protein EJ357_04190 [Streptomyces cyaneochromogenes]